MAQINYAEKSISCKVVYYGPGVSGKTTNLQIIYEKTPGNSKGNMVSLKTEGDRTLYFDFLPLDLGQIKGFSTKFQLYTVPGQIYYNATRKLVLKGVDAVVFIADSSKKKREENIESLENLEENLKELNLTVTKDIPLVIQYNKRDIPNAMPIEEMRLDLNKWEVPEFEAVAIESIGVFKTLKSVAKLFIQEFHEKYGFEVDYEEEKPVEPIVEEKKIEKQETSSINLDDKYSSGFDDDKDSSGFDGNDAIDLEETSYTTSESTNQDDNSIDLEETSYTTSESTNQDDLSIDIDDGTFKDQISINNTNKEESISFNNNDNLDINIEIPLDNIKEEEKEKNVANIEKIEEKNSFNENLQSSNKLEDINELNKLNNDILQAKKELKSKNTPTPLVKKRANKTVKEKQQINKKRPKGSKTFVKRKKKKSFIEKIGSFLKSK